MSIKFEKKVILGSVTSFVVAAIGFIAVFFPDLFNLQKKKIKEFSYEISDPQSAENFHKEIEKIIGGQNTKEDKDLHLYNIKICCVECQNGYKAKIEGEDAIVQLETNDELAYNVFYDGSTMPDSGTTIYRFPADMFGWDKWGKEEGKCYGKGTIIINGYAYYIGSGFNQGITEFSFEKVDERDIKLKDY